MKILIPVFEIQDYGGITGHTELLMRGLKEAGHTVDLVILRNSDRPTYIKKPEGPRNSYRSECGGMVHLLSGWYGVKVIPYGTEQKAREFANWFAQSFDYIIWDLPCPYNNEGAWQILYESGVPQVAVIHDAHYQRAYRHLDDVADKLKFIAPVNESALGAVQPFPGDKRLINNGHEILPESKRIFIARNKIAVCAHVWKAWKNMHRVVEAAPYCDHAHIIMGGDGIEGRYMRSKEKCKPKYKGMWDAFNASEHEYEGVMIPEELFKHYERARVMIDLSWNERFASYGCHYNRSIVEGANHGCVPLVNKEFFAGSKIFPEDTYIGVPKDCSPKELARWINLACSLRQEEADQILGKLRVILKTHFDYRRTSLAYLDV